MLIELLGNANAQTRQVIPQSLGSLWIMGWHAGSIVGVLSTDGIEQVRYILHAASHRANLIQRGSKRHQAVAAYRAIGGLQANNTAISGRLTDRTAGIAAQGHHRFSRCYRRRGTAGGTTRHLIQPVGVMGDMERRVLTGGTHGEFVHVHLAGHHIVHSLQLGDDRRIIGRHKILQHFAGAGRLDILGADVILNADGNTGQGVQLLPCRYLFIHRLGRFHCFLRSGGNESANSILHFGNAGKSILGHFHRGNLFLFHQPVQFAAGQFIQFHAVHFLSLLLTYRLWHYHTAGRHLRSILQHFIPRQRRFHHILPKRHGVFYLGGKIPSLHFWQPLHHLNDVLHILLEFFLSLRLNGQP